MLGFRWKWAGHVSPQTIRAETMDEILAKVKESWHRDLGVPTASATVLNYVRRLIEEHNNLAPTGRRRGLACGEMRSSARRAAGSRVLPGSPLPCCPASFDAGRSRDRMTTMKTSHSD
jgi:hypothetical protein